MLKSSFQALAGPGRTVRRSLDLSLFPCTAAGTATRPCDVDVADNAAILGDDVMGLLLGDGLPVAEISAG